MSRATALSLAALSIALLLFPLALHRPGMPPTLKADEPAYYLMALSLARDGDLRCEPRDLERLYLEFPHVAVQNLILATDDGWHTVYFGKPYLFSLLAAPFAALWGADGMVAFNMALFVAMLWMGALYLRRFNDDATAALFAAGFFFWSTAWTYVFWLHPEVLNMLSAMACLFFGLRAAERPDEDSGVGAGRLGGWLRHPALPAALSGAALTLGVYNKPVIAAVGVPVCLALLLRRRWAALAAWLASAAFALALVCLICWLLMGHPTAYLGIDRAGFTVDSPHRLPIEPIEVVPEERAEELAGRSAGWEWIFRVPEIHWAELWQNLGYFLWGRHTGLFLYQPWSLLALGLFAAFARRSAVRWALLASLLVVAFFFQLFIPFNWHGGGGFVGNRYFVIVYPALLFLVTRVRPDWLVAVGHALGGLLLGSLLLTPMGVIVPYPTLQSHVRGLPFQPFPLEHSLAEIPGYSGQLYGDVWVFGRKDQVRATPDGLQLQGADTVEVWLQTDAPLDAVILEVSSPVSENPVELELGGDRLSLRAGPEPQRVTLEPSRPPQERYVLLRPSFREATLYLHRLRVRSAWGEVPAWRGEGTAGFYEGVSLRYLGASPAAGAGHS